MKNVILFISLSFSIGLSFAQNKDYIVTLAGDTISCNIAETPKRAGLKYVRGKQYLYDYVIVDFGNDSVRIFSPGNIKAYCKYITKKDGKTFSLQMNSDTVNTVWTTLFQGRRVGEAEPKFVRSLIKGGFYNLYFYEEYCYDGGDPYFILEERESKNRQTFVSTKSLRTLLQDWRGAKKKTKRYRNWFTGKQYLVIDYNRNKANIQP